MRLFICEKPSQARDIARVIANDFTKKDAYFENSDTIITWCFGHLLELAPPDDYCSNLKPWRMAVLPVIPDKWVTKPQAKTKKQLTAIGKLLKKASSVVITTDADREGDVIGREVLDFFNYKGGVSRLWLSALDEASVKKALADIRPGASTEKLYQAGLGRQRADWLIGMNLTMAVSSLFGAPGQGVLSVGRVQTPTLKLIVDRDEQIENFKPHDYFEVRVKLTTETHDDCWMGWDIPDELSDGDGKCINKSFADTVLKGIHEKQGEVKHFSEDKKLQSAPLCMSLSNLQKIGSSQFGFGAKEILDIAQSLYEKHKATTYPRTDCGYLPLSQFKEAGSIINALGTIDNALTGIINKCDLTFQSKAWNDKKVTAHHGIIPTLNKQVDIRAMSDKEFKIYDVIRRHYIAQFLGDYEYMARKATVQIGDYMFSSNQNSPLILGWKQILSTLIESDDNLKSNALPALEKGQTLFCSESLIDNKKTKPPARFSEGTVIVAMKSIAKYVDDINLKKVLKETAGIGTEATRANILETLLNREYIAKKDKQLISTKKGRDLISLLPQSITNPATTALWEQELDNIAEGSSDMRDFLEEQADTLEGIIEQLENLSKSKGAIGDQVLHHCPDCKKNMVRRKGKKGYWWGCTGYPDCKTTAFDEKGKPKFILKKEKHES